MLFDCYAKTRPIGRVLLSGQFRIPRPLAVRNFHSSQNNHWTSIDARMSVLVEGECMLVLLASGTESFQKELTPHGGGNTDYGAVPTFAVI